MPLKAATICTPRRAKWTIGIALFISFFLNIPYFFKLKETSGGKVCVAFSDKDAFSVGYSWFLTTINCFLPFTLLLIMNSIIINALRNRGIFLKAEQNGTDDKAKDDTAKTNRQLTITLLSVTFAFIILCAPQYMRYVTYNLKSYTTSPEDYAMYILAAHGSNKFFFTNNAVNFFLYCIGGSKFRQDLWNIFCKKSKTNRRMTSSATAMSVISDPGNKA